MSARAVATIAGNDLRRVGRDRVALFFIVGLPVVVILLIGLSFGGDPGVDVGVLDLDGSNASGELVASLEGRDGIRGETYDSLDELRRDVRTGTMAAGVVVPAGYGDALAAGDDAAVGLVAEPTSTQAAVVQASVRAAVGGEAVRIAAVRLVAGAGPAADGGDGPPGARAGATAAVAAVAGELPEVEVRTTSVDEGAPADLGTFDYTAPSNLVLFTFVNTIVAGALIARERRQGITHRLLATPHGTGTILAGIGTSKFLFALLQSSLIVGVGALVFGVSWGDPLGAALVVVLFAAVATATGLLVGATASDSDQAQAVAIPVAIALAMLGGCMWPLEVVPPPMRVLGHLTPHAWAMDAWQVLIFDGRGVAAIGDELAVLAAFVVGLGLLARRRLRQSLTA